MARHTGIYQGNEEWLRSAGTGVFEGGVNAEMGKAYDEAVRNVPSVGEQINANANLGLTEGLNKLYPTLNPEALSDYSAKMYANMPGAVTVPTGSQMAAPSVAKPAGERSFQYVPAGVEFSPWKAPVPPEEISVEDRKIAAVRKLKNLMAMANRRPGQPVASRIPTDPGMNVQFPTLSQGEITKLSGISPSHKSKRERWLADQKADFETAKRRNFQAQREELDRQFALEKTRIPAVAGIMREELRATSAKERLDIIDKRVRDMKNLDIEDRKLARQEAINKEIQLLEKKNDLAGALDLAKRALDEQTVTEEKNIYLTDKEGKPMLDAMGKPIVSGKETRKVVTPQETPPAEPGKTSEGEAKPIDFRSADRIKEYNDAAMILKSEKNMRTGDPLQPDEINYLKLIMKRYEAAQAASLD